MRAREKNNKNPKTYTKCLPPARDTRKTRRNAAILPRAEALEFQHKENATKRCVFVARYGDLVFLVS